MKRREFITLVGGAAAWPLAARAQQPAMPVIGLLHAASANAYAPFVAGLRQGLSEAGYVEGRNLTIEFRWADDRFDRLPALAADLVRSDVAVIVAGSSPAAIAAKAATDAIPIVFSVGTDPVKAGLVASVNRPGGNATGMLQFNDALLTKRLEILRELVPNAAVIALAVDPRSPATQARLTVLQAAARAAVQEIRVFNVTSQEQFDAIFATVVREHIGALLVPNSTLFTNGRERLVALAAKHAVPAIYEYREFVALRLFFPSHPVQLGPRYL
jgi:putative tryptophan/tyrosine transport system substrate-binding protein